MDQYTIMIIDDEGELLEISREFISNAGFNVVTQNSAVKALEYLEDHEVDGILSDIKMPEMNGIELYQHLYKNNTLPKVFAFISAYGRDYPLPEDFEDRENCRIFLKPAFYYQVAEYFHERFENAGPPCPSSASS